MDPPRLYTSHTDVACVLLAIDGSSQNRNKKAWPALLRKLIKIVGNKKGHKTYILITIWSTRLFIKRSCVLALKWLANKWHIVKSVYDNFFTSLFDPFCCCQTESSTFWFICESSKSSIWSFIKKFAHFWNDHYAYMIQFNSNMTAWRFVISWEEISVFILSNWIRFLRIMVLFSWAYPFMRITSKERYSTIIQIW